MKKIALSTLALLASTVVTAAPTSSSIVLAGGGTVTPAGTLSISLAPLLKDVHYNLTCQVNNPQAEEVDMRFEPSQSYTMYGQVSLNDAALDNLQGSLHSGENTVAVNEISVSGNGNSALHFKNLDFNHAVQVSNCVARPSVKPKLMPTSGGSFVAYNDTGYIVNIKVGNFFPTPYTIYPHSSRWVFVSTDNQNITISDIF